VHASTSVITAEEFDLLFQAFHNPTLALQVDRSQALKSLMEFANDNYQEYASESILVRFVNENGYDACGLTREVMTLVTDELFGVAFESAGQHDLLWLPKDEDCDSIRLQYLTAAGFFTRLAVDTENSLRVPLPIALFKKLRNDPMTVEDYAAVDSRAFASLTSLRAYYESADQPCVFLEDGQDVTQENFHVYESETINSAMVLQVSKAAEAFQRGFTGNQTSVQLSRYSAKQLHAMVVASTTVNWTEMKDSCILKGYYENDVPVQLFWSVFDSLSEEDKLKMLQFITSVNHAPPRGFTRDPITIECESRGTDRLPTAATCFQRFYLPPITDETVMRRGIQHCLEYHQGFGNP
jgi:hypothetical protein